MTAHFYSLQRIRPGEVVQIGKTPVRVLGFERIKGCDKLLRYKCYFERCNEAPTSGFEKLTQLVDHEDTFVLDLY